MKFVCFALLLLLPALGLAQVPAACMPNACGPVQAMPPVPPHFQPAPQPHFEPPHDWHGDHHDGDFHGGWHGYPQPYVNPFKYIAPLVVNFATAPLMVVNPLTGQAQMMTPGQWVLVNAGTPAQTYTWQPLPIWPLSKKVGDTYQNIGPNLLDVSNGHILIPTGGGSYIDSATGQLVLTLSAEKPKVKAAAKPAAPAVTIPHPFRRIRGFLTASSTSNFRGLSWRSSDEIVIHSIA